MNWGWNTCRSGGWIGPVSRPVSGGAVDSIGWNVRLTLCKVNVTSWDSRTVRRLRRKMASKQIDSGVPTGYEAELWP